MEIRTGGVSRNGQSCSSSRLCQSRFGNGMVEKAIFVEFCPSHFYCMVYKNIEC